MFTGVRVFYRHPQNKEFFKNIDILENIGRIRAHHEPMRNLFLKQINCLYHSVVVHLFSTPFNSIQIVMIMFRSQLLRNTLSFAVVNY